MNELARWLLDLPPQASTSARGIDFLHYAVIGVTLLGAFGVFAVALFFIVRYRRRGEGFTPTPRVQGTMALEGLVIGSLLALFLAIWVVGFTQFLALRTPPPGALEVYVTGKQWMWEFAYPRGPASKGILYVPVHRPVKLLLTSRDVIHSFFVPAFRMKQDAVPGRYTVAWFEATEVGTFPVRCAEYCGTSHSAMLADVVVLPADAFERWSAGPEGPAADLMPVAEGAGAPTWDARERRGLVAEGERAAADAGCLLCHSLDGTKHIGPTFSGLFGRDEPLADGTTVRVDEAYMTESMMDPLAKLVAGFAPVMPSYRGRLDPAQTGAILEFIKTLRPTDERAAHPAPRLAPAPSGGAP